MRGRDGPDSRRKVDHDPNRTLRRKPSPAEHTFRPRREAGAKPLRTVTPAYRSLTAFTAGSLRGRVPRSFRRFCRLDLFGKGRRRHRDLRRRRGVGFLLRHLGRVAARLGLRWRTLEPRWARRGKRIRGTFHTGTRWRRYRRPLETAPSSWNGRNELSGLRLQPGRLGILIRSHARREGRHPGWRRLPHDGMAGTRRHGMGFEWVRNGLRPSRWRRRGSRRLWQAASPHRGRRGRRRAFDSGGLLRTRFRAGLGLGLDIPHRDQIVRDLEMPLVDRQIQGG